MIKKTWKKSLFIAVASITLAGATGVHTSFAMGPNENFVITGNEFIRPAAKETAQTARAAADSADVTAAFKDLKFQTAVRNALGLSSNAPITRTACQNITSLDVGNQDIRDLSGIEYFTNLERLFCYENQLTSLDLRHCPNLQYLYCADNQLASLDVSHCPKLTILSCGYNPFTSLDVSHCTELGQLIAVSGRLASLDVSQCFQLQILACENNQLTSLDVSGCPWLSDLSCHGNNMKSVNDVKGRNSMLTGSSFKFSPQRGEKLSQTLTVHPKSLNLYVGGKGQTLKVTGVKGAVTYSINRPHVANVNAKGAVTPKSQGTATITVRASGNNAYKAAATTVKVTVYGKPAAVKSVKATPAKTKGTLKVSWKKVSGASGYAIRYSYKSNMAGYKTLKVPKGGTVSTTIKKLSSRKTVYVQMQAYSVKGSLTIPGAWSKTVQSTSKIR